MSSHAGTKKGTEARRLEELAWTVHAANCSDPSRCDKFSWRACDACTSLRQRIHDEFQRLLAAVVEA